MKQFSLFEIVARTVEQAVDAGWYFTTPKGNPQGPFPTLCAARNAALSKVSAS